MSFKRRKYVMFLGIVKVLLLPLPTDLSQNKLDIFRSVINL